MDLQYFYMKNQIEDDERNIKQTNRFNFNRDEAQRMIEREFNTSEYQNLFLRIEELNNKLENQKISKDELIEHVSKLKEIRDFENNIIFKTLNIIY